MKHKDLILDRESRIRGIGPDGLVLTRADTTNNNEETRERRAVLREVTGSQSMRVR